MENVCSSTIFLILYALLHLMPYGTESVYLRNMFDSYMIINITMSE